MEKIFFAINHPQVEEAIKNALNDLDGFEYEVVFAAVHKDQVVKEIMNKKPTVLILEEGLNGQIETFFLVEKISQRLPNTRIIFLAGERKVGDKQLAKLVAYHVYDIVLGGKVSVKEIVDLVVTPTSYAIASKYLQTKDDFFENDEFSGEDDEQHSQSKKASTTIIVKGDEVVNNVPAPPPKPSLIKNISSFIPKGKPKKEKLPEISDPIQETPPTPSQMSQEPPVPQYQYGAREDGLLPPKPQYSAPQTPIPPPPPQSKWENLMGGGNRKGVKYNPKQQITTFFSVKGGIGTTTTSLNAAAEAASRGGQRVLLIEFNQSYSGLAYWFDFPNAGYGLEDALLGIGSQDYTNVLNAIVTKEKLLERESSAFYENYKALPKNLDYMFFSEVYLKKRIKNSMSASVIQDFLFFCLYQLKYDEIFIDISSDVEREIVEQCLIISGKNVILISQDIAIINNVVMFFVELNKKGLNFDIGFPDEDKRPSMVTEKNIYVINKYYPNSIFTEKKIDKWIKCKNICAIPENGAEVNNLLDSGYIPLLMSKNRQYKEAFVTLGNYIES